MMKLAMKSEAPKIEAKKINLEFETHDLSAQQIRLIRTLNMMLNNVIVAEEEAEFFENSAEFMRIAANLIKQSKYPLDMSKQNNIPYADQALEYAVDVLQDAMSSSKVVNYDN